MRLPIAVMKLQNPKLSAYSSQVPLPHRGKPGQKLKQRLRRNAACSQCPARTTCPRVDPPTISWTHSHRSDANSLSVNRPLSQRTPVDETLPTLSSSFSGLCSPGLRNPANTCPGGCYKQGALLVAFSILSHSPFQ